MQIYCIKCEKEVEARLTDGKEVYLHREDLSKLPFWICDTCYNFVGCHHKTDNPTRPLGDIAPFEVKSLRRYVHEKLDPIWQTGLMGRDELYSLLSEKLGYEFHVAKIRSEADGHKVLSLLNDI